MLTDIENEPDDAQSLVRFLTYANHFDVEGLVATTSRHQKSQTAAWRIREIVEAYGKVRDNLSLHEPGYPTEMELRSVIYEGLPKYGMNAVGAGNDSSGSTALIAAVDRKDDRPLWVPVWGGPNVLAQALWKVKQDRSAEQLASFIKKLRVYTISDQDNSGPWIRKTFPDLFYIASPGVHAGGAYHYATWSGISGDKFHARCDGADFEIVSNRWLDKNIRKGKGPLGAEHPHTEYLMEGDTPSFLGLVHNGLNDLEHPNWGSWGGRYEFYTPRMQKWFQEPETRPFWSDAVDEVVGNDGAWHTTNHATIWRWRSAYQNDFAARIAWTTKSFEEANHPPVVTIATPERIKAKRGEVVQLSGEGTSDPDGDALSFHWFHYGEAGSFTSSSGSTGHPVSIHGFDQPTATVTIPNSRFMPPGTGTMHILLAVTDHGTPRLTRYRRVIIDVVDDPVAAIDESPEYLRTIRKRVAKIIANANIDNRESCERVQHVLIDQYRWLNAVHTQRDQDTRSIQTVATTSDAIEEQVAALHSRVAERTEKRHIRFVAQLSQYLDTHQVDAIKNGMTYGLVDHIFATFERQFPELTEDQRTRIQSELISAREAAIDAGSSEEKHRCFRKHVGRINNFLSQAGYDLKSGKRTPQSVDTQ